MDQRITLAQAIRELRSQLEEAAESGEGAKVRFVPRSVEVELTITFSIDTEVGGGFKLLSLIDLSGKASQGGSNTHKITLTLAPVGADGGPTLIGDNEREID